MKKKTFLIAFITSLLVACNNGSGSEIIHNTEYFELPSAPIYEMPNESTLEEYKTFYFDSLKGKDTNNGLSILSPKKTLNDIPNIINTYGSNSHLRLLLAKGSTFTGSITLGGYESSEAYPFILSSYGEGDRPIIESSCLDSAIVDNYIIRIQEPYTYISGLEITGPTCTRGIYVLPRKSGIFENIVIRDCYVHDLNWNWEYEDDPKDVNPEDIDVESVTPYQSVNRYRRLYGGIEIFNGTIDSDLSRKTGPIVYNNLFIENNKIERVSHVGINIYNYWVNRGGVGYGYNKYVLEDPNYQDFENGIGYFPHTNVVIRNNYLDVIGGDAIIADGVDNSWIIHNVGYRASYLGRAGMFNASIWVHNARHSYMCYNEAAYTYLRNGSGDGEGFDIDNACEDIKVCYNYAHHNEGGGILLCNLETELFTYDKDGNLISDTKTRLLGEWKDNYIANNVFAFNGIKRNNERSAFVTIARNCSNATFDNNTVVIGDIEKQRIINCEGNVVSYNHKYRRNIFVCVNSKAQPIFSTHTVESPLFEGNCYFNIADGNPLENQLVISSDLKARILDPKLIMPDEFEGYDKCHQYIIDSKIVKNAEYLEKQLTFDINNNSTKDIAYLGAAIK